MFYYLLVCRVILRRALWGYEKGLGWRGYFELKDTKTAFLYC